MPTYAVIPTDSPVMLESESNLHPVHIESRQLTGTVEVALDAAGKPDLSTPVQAHLRIPVDSLRSGNGLQDREMQRRLDTRRNPEITVEVTDVTALDADGRYHATARIAVRGQSELVDGDVAVSIDGDRLVVEGEQTIDMRSFGVQPPRLLVLKVQPEVLVHVRITAQRQD